MDSTNDVIVRKISPSIGFHSFSSCVSERQIRFELLKFKDSIYLWIGDSRNRNFEDLSLALMSKYSKEPTSTKLIGDIVDLTSTNLANKLSKKLNKPVYVSYNLPDDRLTIAAVNQIISEELKNNASAFDCQQVYS